MMDISRQKEKANGKKEERKESLRERTGRDPAEYRIFYLHFIHWFCLKLLNRLNNGTYRIIEDRSVQVSRCFCEFYASSISYSDG